MYSATAGDYMPPPPKKKRTLSCSDKLQFSQQNELIPHRLLSFLDINTSSSFILNKHDESGGTYTEWDDDENLFLPNYEQEQQINVIKPIVILDTLHEKLTQCNTKVNGEAILKLLKVTGDLEGTKFMNNQKLKHQEVPHKETIRVIVNDLVKTNNIAETSEKLRKILEDAKQ